MLKPYEIAYCGIFGAAALLLPVIFHIFHAGHFFMPMYLPLVALGFFVRPAGAGLTACLIPQISCFLTGMPPFFPPVAFIMSVEISIMAMMIAFIRTGFPDLKVIYILFPVIILGRLINFILVYTSACLMKLPPAFLAGTSLLSGWPGIVLMLIVIPVIVRYKKSEKN